MPDSFQLELPDPDPDEQPLELESPAGDVEAIASGASPPRAHRFFSDGELPPPPAESLLSGDADELWQASVEREARANLRFTLAEMFFVTALLAVILTVGRFVRLPLLAGVLGFLVLIGLGNLSHQQRPRWAQIVWLTLILAYAFVAVGAAWNVD